MTQTQAALIRTAATLTVHAGIYITVAVVEKRKKKQQLKKDNVLVLKPKHFVNVD